ncbi:hypothetical protein GGF32_003314 [Allomyces javanicus]|nr:hypothetical protein GGF32_003314 [Allomyces javanicus]
MAAEAPLHVFVGGTFGGIAQVLVGYPFDSVKVMMQTGATTAAAPSVAAVSPSGVATATMAAQGVRAPSPVQVLQATLRAEGVRGLFKGVASPMAGVGVCNAVLFTAQSTFNSHVRPGDRSPTKFAITGTMSGLVISLLSCPMELLKVRMQAQPLAGSSASVPRYTGVVDCLIKTVRADGLRRGIYRGWTMTALRDMPSFAAYFATYEALRQHEVSPFISGGLAGIACWLPCYPQDVLKSRIQTAPSTVPWRVVAASYLRDHGARGLWRGLSPTLLRAFPANAATFAVYELYRSVAGIA